MKIVYCIDSLSHSAGMERVLTTKANYLSENYKYDVYIVTKKGKHNPFFELYDKIKIVFLDANSNKDYYKKLSEALLEIKPDIAISLYGSEASFLYKIKDGSKKIIEFHFSKYYLTHLVNGIKVLKYRRLHLLKAWYIQKKEEYLASKYDKVVLLTKQDLELWGNKGNMTYIHNPLSFRSDKVSCLENKKIIAVGRLIAQKGFDLLIESFDFVSQKYPEWTLDIYGDGPDYELLNALILKYNLSDNIKLHTPVLNIKEKLLESSIFVFPSRYEGFGLVLTEAMECGLPCIAFDCECGPREIIEDNVSGFLVPKFDLNEFSLKICFLIENFEQRKILGSNSKRLAENFNIDLIMKKWNILFNKIIMK